jgi:hypothetical protein
VRLDKAGTSALSQETTVQGLEYARGRAPGGWTLFDAVANLFRMLGRILAKMHDKVLQARRTTSGSRHVCVELAHWHRRLC